MELQQCSTVSHSRRENWQLLEHKNTDLLAPKMKSKMVREETGGLFQGSLWTHLRPQLGSRGVVRSESRQQLMADAEPGARSTKHGAWAIPRKVLDRSCRPQGSMFSVNPKSEGTDPALPFLIGEQSLIASSRASQECCCGSVLFQSIPTFSGCPYFSGTSLLLSRLPRQNSISPAGSFREGVGIVTSDSGTGFCNRKQPSWSCSTEQALGSQFQGKPTPELISIG